LHLTVQNDICNHRTRFLGPKYTKMSVRSRPELGAANPFFVYIEQAEQIAMAR